MPEKPPEGGTTSLFMFSVLKAEIKSYLPRIGRGTSGVVNGWV
jgi:hypothetical protein